MLKEICFLSFIAMAVGLQVRSWDTLVVDGSDMNVRALEDLILSGSDMNVRKLLQNLSHQNLDIQNFVLRCLTSISSTYGTESPFMNFFLQLLQMYMQQQSQPVPIPLPVPGPAPAPAVVPIDGNIIL